MRLVSKLLIAFLAAAPLAAQQPGLSRADLDQRIERQVRTYSGVPPDAKVTIGDRTPGSFNGYDNVPVTIERAGTKDVFNFLLSKDGRKLLYVKEFDLGEDPYARIMKKIDIARRPIRGAADAKVTIVVYDDFQCPFCGRTYVTLFNEVMTRYRDRVRVLIKDFPILDAHPWAMRAAVDAQCLAQQDSEAYWEFSDYVHTHQQEITQKNNALAAGTASPLDLVAKDVAQKHGVNAAALQACLTAQDKSQVEASMREGQALGISATPTIFVNGQMTEGVLSAEQLRALLDRVLSESAAPAK
ncbi:MAG: DsbA family protein [Acidobacteriia bacterium]|nr:DsbA family protein [Terriglobia bacterium]